MAPLGAHPLDSTASTPSHMSGEWMRLGVGAPSHAPVPLHFQGHQRATLWLAKSSTHLVRGLQWAFLGTHLPSPFSGRGRRGLMGS